ncbi:MAG: alpha/beta hydrolase, partial [Candidatus Promineifilaceae bacterium]
SILRSPRRPTLALPQYLVEGMTTLSEWQSSGIRITVQGLNIFTRVIGNGPPILILHGFPTSSYDYSRIIPPLSEHYQLILFDYPGFGLSDKPNLEIYSIHKYAEVAQYLVDYLGLHRVKILAHDIGDSVALELLGNNPNMIENIVLLNGSIISTPFEDYQMLLAQRLLLTHQITKFLNRLRFINKLFFMAMMRKAFFKELPPDEFNTFWKLFCVNQGDTIYYHLIQYMPERREFEKKWLEYLKTHSAPLTMIWGQDDPIAPPSITSDILKIRPNSTSIILENTAHYPHWESPQKTISGILQAFKG